jgi:hypothetical protein
MTNYNMKERGKIGRVGLYLMGLVTVTTFMMGCGRENDGPRIPEIPGREKPAIAAINNYTSESKLATISTTTPIPTPTSAPAPEPTTKPAPAPDYLAEVRRSQENEAYMAFGCALSSIDRNEPYTGTDTMELRFSDITDRLSENSEDSPEIRRVEIPKSILER